MPNSEQRFDEALLRRKVASVLEDRFGATLEQTQIGLGVADFARICAECGVRMPAELTMLAKTLLNLDQIGRTLDPSFNPNEAIERNAFQLTGDRLRKTLTPASILTAAIEAKEFSQELPRRLNKILDLISKNELTIHIDAIEERTLVDGFQKIANRIATGLILAALIVGAAMLMRVDTPFKLFGYPGLAILCFIAAVIGGLWLLVEIILNDRRMRKV
jgi:predicted unusual protein kinase regulating ubiquinone biosynthesis (AarF/ABC1/UbiB family)